MYGDSRNTLKTTQARALAMGVISLAIEVAKICDVLGELYLQRDSVLSHKEQLASSVWETVSSKSHVKNE